MYYSMTERVQQMTVGDIQEKYAHDTAWLPAARRALKEQSGPIFAAYAETSSCPCTALGADILLAEEFTDCCNSIFKSLDF